MRLDQYLVKAGHFSSRHQAQVEIKHGRIKVDGVVIKKPSKDINESQEITVLEAYNPYVSQGGLKLIFALETFKLDVQNMNVMDVGSSTGGFTDVLLKNGAASVKAIDVGRAQMVEPLRSDPRVHLHEETHFLDAPESWFTAIDLIVMDVSFTSSLPLIFHAYRTFSKQTIVLIKPQFETVKTPASGVIKDKKLHIEVLRKYQDALNDQALYIKAIKASPDKGKQTNLEFLCLLDLTPSTIDVKAVVEAAHMARK